MIRAAGLMLSVAALLPMHFGLNYFGLGYIGVSKEKPMALHAKGTFTVAMKPLTPAPADGLMRFSLDKQIHGDLEGTTKGEMFAGGDYAKGAAGYVAIEVVTGTLAGKKGSFALMQMATLDADGPQLTARVVPGSGTGSWWESPGCLRSTRVAESICGRWTTHYCQQSCPSARLPEGA